MPKENHKWHLALRCDRTCTRCDKFKPRAEFNDGRYRCKRCSAEGQREWAEKNPEKSRRLRVVGNLRKYGLTPEKYDTMLAAQSGSCAICRRPDNEPFSMFAVDHDHGTGRVRGLLCTNCNVLIGHARDEPEILRSAAEYLNVTR